MKDSLLDQWLHFPPHHAHWGAAILATSHYPGAPISNLLLLFWASKKKNRTGLKLGTNQLKIATCLQVSTHACRLDTGDSARVYCAATLSHPCLLSPFLPPSPLNIPSPLLSSHSLHALLIIRLTSLGNELFSQYSQQCPQKGLNKKCFDKKYKTYKMAHIYNMPTVSQVK